MSQTIRRDVLKRRVAEGRVVMRGSFHFDDLRGQTQSANKSIPVALTPTSNDWREMQNGVLYLYDSDFTAGSGCAYNANVPGRQCVSLIVHSNCSYDLEILDEPFFQLMKR